MNPRRSRPPGIPPHTPPSSPRRVKPVAGLPSCERQSLMPQRPRETNMFKLIIGNRAYSSWSMRGWLACKQSGEQFEELVVPMFDDAWEKRREGDEFAPSLGKVPILWDGECVVWDSLAIIEFLADRYGDDLYWPESEIARAVARSMSAEMHSGFANLRRELPMNVRKSFPPKQLSDEVRSEIDRVLQLWAQARARFGGTGDFLFADGSAPDMMYAP